MFLRGLYPLGISAGCLPSIKLKFKFTVNANKFDSSCFEIAS